MKIYILSIEFYSKGQWVPKPVGVYSSESLAEVAAKKYKRYAQLGPVEHRIIERELDKKPKQ